MTRRILSIVSALLLPLGTLAQEVGGYGFLDIPVSARLSAMGGSVISISESESSLTQHNPSLLGSDMHRQVSLSYLNWLSDIHLANVSYTHRFLSEGAWQAGVRYVSYGEFEGYDEWGVSTGSFSAHDVAFTLSVGHPLTEHWRIGGSVRAIGSKYESESAFALGVDAGLNFYNNETGRSWSLSVTNLGGQLKSLGERHIHMPTRLLVGYTKELEHLPFALTLTGLDLLNWDHTNLLDHLLFSCEWISFEHFYLAAGYNYHRQHQHQGSGGFLRGLSFGGGLHFQQWQFSCSYARYNAVAGSLHLELQYQF